MATSAVHALGYVGAISEADLERIDRAAYSGTALIGKQGVESAFEQKLHGLNGSREILVNAQGRSVEKQGAFIPTLHTHAPTAGDDIILAMDLKTQQRGRRRPERPARRRGCDRSQQRRRHCDDEPPRVRSQHVRPRHHEVRIHHPEG